MWNHPRPPPPPPALPRPLPFPKKGNVRSPRRAAAREHMPTTRTTRCGTQPRTSSGKGERQQRRPHGGFGTRSPHGAASRFQPAQPHVQSELAPATPQLGAAPHKSPWRLHTHAFLLTLFLCVNEVKLMRASGTTHKRCRQEGEGGRDGGLGCRGSCEGVVTVREMEEEGRRSGRAMEARAMSLSSPPLPPSPAPGLAFFSQTPSLISSTLPFLRPHRGVFVNPRCVLGAAA